MPGSAFAATRPRPTGAPEPLRPLAENPHAFEELRALLAARQKLYARADHTVDTSGKTVKQVVAELAGQ